MRSWWSLRSPASRRILSRCRLNTMYVSRRFTYPNFLRSSGLAGKVSPLASLICRVASMGRS